MSQTAKENRSVVGQRFQLLLGPALFLILCLVPMEGMDRNAQICIAVYVWLIVWWAFKPIPWLATGLVPLLVLPVMNVIDLKTLTSKMYGQRIFFLLIFLFLLSKVVERQGLAKRMAVRMLAVKWIDGKVNRFILMYMAATALMEALFGSVGAIVSVPIGISVIDHICSECDRQNIAVNKTKMGAHIILASAYGHIAGGVLTIQGVPQNILVLSIYEELFGQNVSYFQWMITGIPLAAAALAAGYLILNVLYRHEIKEIPGGAGYLRREEESLGKIKQSEKRLILILTLIVVLWIATTFVSVPGLDFFSVAMLGLFLLYLVPQSGEEQTPYLTISDAKTLNWDVIMLVVGAVGFSDILTSFGVIDFVAARMSGLHGITLLLIATFATGLMTNFLAGMATATAMGTLLLPLLATTGIHPLVAVRVISIMAVGLMVPWAGTSAALFFGSQRLDMKEMCRTGIIMFLALGILFIGLCLLLMNIPFLFPPIPG